MTGLDILPDTSSATFSPCRTWRYELRRTWEARHWPLVMLMLNPSTADEVVNDPTVERCERRARAGGFGGLVVLNIFAFRATDPVDMKAAADPVGPENDAYLGTYLEAVGNYGGIICAGWGVHGSHLGRDQQVRQMAEAHHVQLMCLGTTKEGHPRHPLYVGYSTGFQPWIGR